MWFPKVDGMVDVEGKRRVLVVDDDRDMAEAVAALLTIYGHELRIAHSGNDALAIADTFDPDIVILDVALPDLSGYDVARQIRVAHPGVFLVALTGYVRAVDQERAYRAGYDLHVAKPISATTLQAVFRASSQPSASRSRGASTCLPTSDPT